MCLLSAHCLEPALAGTGGTFAPPFSEDRYASDQRCLFPNLSKIKNNFDSSARQEGGRELDSESLSDVYCIVLQSGCRAYVITWLQGI